MEIHREVVQSALPASSLPREENTLDSIQTSSGPFPELIRDQTINSVISTDNILSKSQSRSESESPQIQSPGENIDINMMVENQPLNGINDPSGNSSVKALVSPGFPLSGHSLPTSNKSLSDDEESELGLLGGHENNNKQNSNNDKQLVGIHENEGSLLRGGGGEKEKSKLDSKGNEKKFPSSYEKKAPSVPGFLMKTFDIFSNPDYDDYCSWGNEGTTIIVKDAVGFAHHVLPNHFKHSNFQSFVRQLNMYNFHKTIQDPQHNEFKHEFFLKDRLDLLHKIKRKVGAGEKTSGGSHTGQGGNVGNASGTVGGGGGTHGNGGTMSGNKRNYNGQFVEDHLAHFETKIFHLENFVNELKTFYETALNTLSLDNQKLNSKVVELQNQVRNLNNSINRGTISTVFSPQGVQHQHLQHHQQQQQQQSQAVANAYPMSHAPYFNGQNANTTKSQPNAALIHARLHQFDGKALVNKNNSLEGGGIPISTNSMMKGNGGNAINDGSNASVVTSTILGNNTTNNNNNTITNGCSIPSFLNPPSMSSFNLNPASLHPFSSTSSQPSPLPLGLNENGTGDCKADLNKIALLDDNNQNQKSNENSTNFTTNLNLKAEIGQVIHNEEYKNSGNKKGNDGNNNEVEQGRVKRLRTDEKGKSIEV